MVSRTMGDYEAVATAGVLAVSEPAFWAGFDRSPAGFVDYFRQLTEWSRSGGGSLGLSLLLDMPEPQGGGGPGKAR